MREFFRKYICDFHIYISASNILTANFQAQASINLASIDAVMQRFGQTIRIQRDSEAIAEVGEYMHQTDRQPATSRYPKTAWTNLQTSCEIRTSNFLPSRTNSGHIPAPDDKVLLLTQTRTKQLVSKRSKPRQKRIKFSHSAALDMSQSYTLPADLAFSVFFFFHLFTFFSASCWVQHPDTVIQHVLARKQMQRSKIW